VGLPATTNLPMPTSKPRLAVVCDFAAENWPSMDLVAEMLLANLAQHHAGEVHATPVRPEFVRRFSRVPVFRRRQLAFSADRFVNRMWDYPRYLRRWLDRFDYFHICDHSYAHLVHALPAERTGVYCHDLDCFRCLLDPGREPRPRWFRALSQRILLGLQKAAVVFYSTAELGRRLREYGFVGTNRLVHAPYGVAPEFTLDLDSLDSRVGEITGSVGAPFLLHVGSCIPRKRIDVLLDVFAGVKARFPNLVLVQIGGEWTPAQREQIACLGISSAVSQQRGIDRRTLAALYRQARTTLQPSEAEGFGLPVIEALACAGVIVASDIPVLREVGGDGAVYCPVADVPRWVETVGRLLTQPSEAPDRAKRLAQAHRFSWAHHAQTILHSYRPDRRCAA
jgi:glycosyltransferase involved in cell wall biosynthesis